MSLHNSIKTNKSTQRHFLLFLATALFILFQLIFQKPLHANDEVNIVADIISAPVLSNGIQANEPTEFNLIMNASGLGKDQALDPQVFGYQIPAGGRMEVELGGGFTRNTIINSAGVREPVAIKPNANIILTTGPQNPIIFQNGATVARGNWSVTDDGKNTITITPNGGFAENGLENTRANEIGIKVIHVRPNPRTIAGMPFTNGNPGEKGTVAVRIYNALNVLIARGMKSVEFRAYTGRQVNNTNEGLRTPKGGSPVAETIELIDFQRVAPNTSLTNSSAYVPFSAGAPYAPRFVLFEALDENVRGQFTQASFIPQAGIANVTYEVKVDEPWKANLVEVTPTQTLIIGTILLTGPDEHSPGLILPSQGLTILNKNGSFLNVPTKVGASIGTYKVMINMHDGGSATTHIIVE